jgi:hypothetical protein
MNGAIIYLSIYASQALGYFRKTRAARAENSNASLAVPNSNLFMASPVTINSNIVYTFEPIQSR